MRVSELKDRQVIDPTSARKRGRVVDVLINPTTQRLLGVLIALDGEDSVEPIGADLIARIGADAVMLRGKLDEHTTALAANGEGYLDYTSLTGLQVLDDGGNHIGHLNDAKIDPDNLAITAYALVDSGWRHWLGLQSEIRPSEVTSWSRELMLIKPRGPGAADTTATTTGQEQAEELPAGASEDPQIDELAGDVHVAEDSADTAAAASPTRRKRRARRDVRIEHDQESYAQAT